MTAPVINSVTFDKPLYNTGDTVTMTIDYIAGVSAAAAETVNVSGTATDVPSGDSTPFSGSYQVQGSAPAPDSTTWVVSDNDGRTYAQVSDSGAIAVFTTTA